MNEPICWKKFKMLTVHKSKMKRFLCWCDRQWCRLKATKQNNTEFKSHDARYMTPNHNVSFCYNSFFFTSPSSSSLLFCWWMNLDFVSHHFYINITILYPRHSLWSLFGIFLHCCLRCIKFYTYMPTPWRIGIIVLDF